MVKRKIVEIDEEKCDGCGLCIPNCPEGALQIIDGKARLVSDLFCDGLGACIGHCPRGAIEIVEREAEPYDERKVMKKIAGQGPNVIKAHLEHLREHGEEGYLKEAVEYLEENSMEVPVEQTKEKKLLHGCPGSRVMDFKDRHSDSGSARRQASELKQWPVQLTLVPPNAPYFDNADLLVSADCVAFAHPNFHSDLLRGKTLVVGCPTLDDIVSYVEKLTGIIRDNNIKSVTVAIMEVPCCNGMHFAVEKAIGDSGKDIRLVKKVISISGEVE